MAFIRGQERLVYESVKDYLVAQLTALGWIDSAINGTTVMGPYGATVSVTLEDQVPEDKIGAVADNTVAFTSGREPADAESELGASSGGLWTTDHVFHVDILGENQGIARALQSDVRAILTGRLEGASRYIDFIDKSVSPAVVPAGHLLHFEDVETDTPLNQPYKQDWRVVHLTAVHEYNAAEVPV